MKKTIFLLAILLCCISCKKTYLALNGVRKPRFETEASVARKLSTYDPGYTAINTTPKDSLAFKNLLRVLRGLPSSLFFDRKGFLIDDQEKKYCAGRAMKFAVNLNPNEILVLDSAITLDDIVTNIKSIPAISENQIPYHFTMVIFWTNFLGRANGNVFRIMEEMKSRKDLRVNYMLINMDVQQSWGMNKIPYVF